MRTELSAFRYLAWYTIDIHQWWPIPIPESIPKWFTVLHTKCSKRPGCSCPSGWLACDSMIRAAMPQQNLATGSFEPSLDNLQGGLGQGRRIPPAESNGHWRPHPAAHHNIVTMMPSLSHHRKHGYNAAHFQMSFKLAISHSLLILLTPVPFPPCPILRKRHLILHWVNDTCYAWFLDRHDPVLSKRYVISLINKLSCYTIMYCWERPGPFRHCFSAIIPLVPGKIFLLYGWH